MEKLKSCSFYFLLQSISKKYFLFIFITVVFVTNSFFISKAFASTSVGLDIIEDTTWTLNGSPYLIGSSIVVMQDITLTIEPGVVVKFSPNTNEHFKFSLFVFGKIIANGEEGSGIYFTSNNDDVGGSTDGDYESCDYESYDDEGNPIGGEVCENIDKEASAGEWGGIYFMSSIDSSLKNVFFRYANETLTMESSSVNIENLNINDCVSGLTAHMNSQVNILGAAINNANSNYFISIFDRSLAIFDGVNITGNNSLNTAVGVFLSSSLTFNNSSVAGIGDGLTIFRESSMTASNISLECGNDGILAFRNASLIISDGSISCLNHGIYIFSESSADINGVKITDAMEAGLMAHSNTNPKPISINKSEITGNNYGFLVFGSEISAHENNIHDNLLNGAITYPQMDEDGNLLPPVNLDFINNYWGDPSGPFNSTNPDGLGNEVSDGIIFSPFLKVDPLVPIIPTKNPVIIIPGVMGTEMYNGSEKLWIDLFHNLTDIGDQFMDALQLKSDLTPQVERVTIGDIIRKEIVNVGIGEVLLFDYSYGLIQELKNQGYIEDTDLFVFPYDWRYGISEVTIQKLKQRISDILIQTGRNKVDIIAHSTGGLLTKKYVMDNQIENHIGKAIFVGVPNTGAPQAIKTFLVGNNFGNLFLANSETKKISVNMPIVYDLSPSQQYYNNKGSFVEIIDNFLFHSADKKDLDFKQTDEFLINERNLNKQALSNARNLHTLDFDNYDLRKDGIDVYNIVGCKAGTTGKVIERRTHGLFGVEVEYDKPKEVPGDGTVPLESATNLPVDQNHKYFALNASHGKMPSQNGIRQQIVNIISGSNLSTENIITQDISLCKLNGRAISVYSPLSIDVVDQDNNHSGLFSDGVSIENNIPNASFEIMGDRKFVYLPEDEGQTYYISIKGTGNGVFTVTDSKIIDNQTVSMQVFEDIPVTQTLTGSINIGDVTNIVIEGNNEIINPTYILESSQVDDFDPTHKKEINNKNISHTYGGSSIAQIIATPVINDVIKTKKNFKDFKISSIIMKKNPTEISFVAAQNQSNVVEKNNLVQVKNNNLLESASSSRTNVGYWILAGTLVFIFVLLLVIKIIKR